MKFYNPFKPHIVLANDGKYYIRKYVFVDGFLYKLKNYHDSWFTLSDIIIAHDGFVSYEDAQLDLLNYNESLKKKFKVIKVLNDA